MFDADGEYLPGMPSLRNEAYGYWALAYSGFDEAVAKWAPLYEAFGLDMAGAREHAIRWAFAHGYVPPNYVRRAARPGDTIAQIKAQTRIEDVANRLTGMRWHGPARRTGRGPCPIHKGRNPSSFAVYVDTQSFFCFTCNEGGDVITLLRRTGLDNA